ncbi:MAG: asparagine--tRNA ligase [Clostridia bacterium]
MILTTKQLRHDYEKYVGKSVKVNGWIKTIRDNKSIGFLELTDGYFKPLQVVLIKEKLFNYDELIRQNIGASFCVVGEIVLTPQNKQPFDLIAKSVDVLGECATDFPLQRKQRSTLEFLRAMPSLRHRTNTFNAVFRIRSVASFLIHQFYQEKDFVYLNTPIITGSDCEGAGDMFQVTTLPIDKIKGEVDYSKDFFGKKAFLTVSGQLNEECFTHGFKNTYTFGPTFRAENSNTTRHAAEFWMMEPEMCFVDLNGLMDNEEQMLKYVINGILNKCPDEIEFLNKFVDTELLNRLENILESQFERLDYTKAIELLKKENSKFNFKVEWGCDLQTEHERYLTETLFKKPVFVTNWPREIKSFYMKQNADGKTVAAVDLLVPGVGELMGGSQREENLEKLLTRMKECNLQASDYQWYVNLRRYGTCVHSGFGLGFERLVMYLTGITNIRDVCLFPRTPTTFEG